MHFRRTGALRGACLAFLCCLIFPIRANAAAVALTFDDGPSGKLTEELLALLAEEDVPATFFLCGYRIAQYGESAALLRDTPHELGVHGFTHGYLDRMDGAALARELSDTADAIEAAAGRRPTLFRPPGGRSGEAVRAEAARQGYPLILWSVDPEDWCPDCGSAAIVRRVTAHPRDGDVILLHEISRRTLDALPEIIETLRREGFTFLTVSALAAQHGVTLAPGAEYTRFSSDSQ